MDLVAQDGLVEDEDALDEDDGARLDVYHLALLAEVRRKVVDGDVDGLALAQQLEVLQASKRDASNEIYFSPALGHRTQPLTRVNLRERRGEGRAQPVP